MNTRTKKDLIYLSIGLFIAFSFCFLIFDIIIENGVEGYDMQNASFKEKVKLYFDIDSCLDDSGCWDHIRHRCEHEDNGYCINSKEECIERNGTWQADTQYCKLKEK